MIFRRSISERIEYLRDLWNGKAEFSLEPSDAKLTGYSWLYKEDAKQKMRELRRIDPTAWIGLMQILFERNPDGTWKAVIARPIEE